jgi:hypothetical protein
VKFGDTMDRAYEVSETMWKLRHNNPLCEAFGDKSKVWDSISDLNKMGQIAYFYTTENVFIGAVAFVLNADFAWWADHLKVLEEVFVVSMNTEYAGFGRVAAMFLKDLAEANECDLVFAGAFLGKNNSYTKVGYLKGYPTFVYKVGE